MKKNRSTSSVSPSQAAKSISGLLYMVTAAAALAAAGLLMVSDGPWNSWYTLGLAGLIALLAFALVNALINLGLPPTASARGAVLASFLPGLVFWVYASRIGNEAASCWLLIGMGLASCLGGFLATTILEGFIENNAPPGQKIQEEVLFWHRQVIGDPPATPKSKRVFDILLSGLGVLFSAPLWLFFGLLIWLESPGPVVFVKNSVGRGGRNFHQYKFRTMVGGAEQESGPVLAGRHDQRVLRIGSFLRKTALDELPQLINILKGEMSFVGPRPQRTVLVHQYLQRIPDYARRHQLPPGLAGLAQVAAGYDITPREKLQWDLLYLSRASLKYDLWLLGLAFVLVFWLRWKKGGAERGLPRQWLKIDPDEGQGRD